MPAMSALNQAQRYLAQGEGAQAVHLMQSATLQEPGNAQVWTALGVALRFTGCLEESAAAFARALALAPERADAQVYLGMIRLAQGRQQEGWPLYQARWRNPHWTDKLRYPAQALWQGQITPGMRLLMWGEQGLGDIIQFSRYAPWLLRQLRSQGGTLALEVPAVLGALLRASWPMVDVVDMGAARGHFDAHVPLMDLPTLWGNCVGAGGLPYQPMPVPYLAALPTARKTGSGAMTRAGSYKVGIAWQGRTSHPDDRLRSIGTAALADLFAVPGVQWVSLQKDSETHPSGLARDVALCHDFADTARLVGELDLVVSIDSAVAHLAGALGKPVWLLLPEVADWRWQLAGEDSPWYPSMRLFRQASEDGGWGPVVGRVAAALRDRR
jgi:hypothetical protein